MVFTQEQLALTFAYMSYYGIAFHGSDKANDLAIAKDINHALTTWHPVNDEWELVWGPRVSAFKGDLFDDNMMFVVKRKPVQNKSNQRTQKQTKQEHASYVIAIRGTNPFSIKDWLIEDFDIFSMKAWPYGTPGKLKPKISKAAWIGLTRLQQLVATEGVPGAGQTLLQFLQSELAVEGSLNICVTGHSLGGALAPTLALWLKDIQSVEFPSAAGSSPLQISTIAFAGPSAGNQDFAAYSDHSFGVDCQRISNSLDVVPHAWNTKSLLKLYTLYARNFLLPGPVLSAGFSYMLAISLKGRYTQIQPKSKPLTGRYKYFLYNYFAQALYQHVIGYPEIMGMLKHQDIPLAALFSPHLNGLHVCQN